MGSQKTQLRPGAGGQFGLNAGDANMRLSGNPVPYLMPWATAFVLLILAVAIRYGLARDTLSWYWSLFVMAVYAGLTVLAWWTSRPRGRVTHLLATGGVAAGGLWSWYIAGVPDLTWRPFAVYIGASVLVCGGSMFFVAFRNGPGDGTGGMHEQIGGAVAKLRALNEVTTKDGQVVARYEMEPGTPAAELQSAAPALASLYGVPADGVRVLPSSDDARVGEMRINPTNTLAKPLTWTGPSIRSGGSIMDPIVVGQRRGGQPLHFWLPGDAKQGRNASLMQVTGMPGAGKTEFIRYVLLELLSRGMPDEVEFWYGNSRKADQEPDWVKRGAARFESDRKGVARMLHDLRAESPERARILGEQGLDQWQPGCGLAYRLVICDEFADVATDVERVLTDITETIRSLGENILLGLQRASGSRFPTDARSNMGTLVCFGTKDEVDAGMALPDEVLDAGAQPWRWGNKQPGMCYLTAPGVDEDLWTDEGRTFRPNRDLMGQWADYYLARRAGRATTAPAQPATPPTVRTASAAAYTAAQPAERETGSDLQEPRDGEALDDVIDLDDIDEGKAAAEVDDVLDEISDDLGDGELDEFDDDMPAKPHVPIDCNEAVDIDHREPIEVFGGGMRLALSPKMPPSEARDHVRRFLADLHSTGVRRFKKEDMAGDVLAAVGYRASWLDKVLAEFANERPTWLVRTDDRGWYDINASPLLALEGDAA
jgi:hypothetical protein